MKLTNIPTRTIYTGLCICLASLLFTGCKKLAGLDLQQDTDHEITILDPHINKSAWQFLKDRATGPVGTQDTIFRRMYEGILYAGIDSNEYKKPGRTYIFLHNDAIWRTGNPTPVDSYFGRYKVNNIAATKWQDYTPQQVKNWLLYLIMEGEYSFDNVTPDNVEVKTLMPEGADAANPKSVMTFKVLNDRDSKWRINDFFNTVRATQARTAGIQSDNGPVHVVDRLVEYGVK